MLKQALEKKTPCVTIGKASKHYKTEKQPIFLCLGFSKTIIYILILKLSLFSKLIKLNQHRHMCRPYYFCFDGLGKTVNYRYESCIYF